MTLVDFEFGKPFSGCQICPKIFCFRIRIHITCYDVARVKAVRQEEKILLFWKNLKSTLYYINSYTKVLIIIFQQLIYL